MEGAAHEDICPGAEAFGDIYTDDAVIWHNTDGKEQSAAESIATLRARRGRRRLRG